MRGERFMLKVTTRTSVQCHSDIDKQTIFHLKRELTVQPANGIQKDQAWSTQLLQTTLQPLNRVSNHA